MSLILQNPSWIVECSSTDFWTCRPTAISWSISLFSRLAIIHFQSYHQLLLVEVLIWLSKLVSEIWGLYFKHIGNMRIFVLKNNDVRLRMSFCYVAGFQSDRKRRGVWTRRGDRGFLLFGGVCLSVDSGHPVFHFSINRRYHQGSNSKHTWLPCRQSVEVSKRPLLHVPWPRG